MVVSFSGTKVHGNETSINPQYHSLVVSTYRKLVEPYYSKMASTVESNCAKSLEDTLRKYEESTHSHFNLKYADKNFFDESMCLCVTSCVFGESPAILRHTPSI